MLFLVAIIYWLLCLRFRIQIDVSYEDGQGQVAFLVGIFALKWRQQTRIVRKTEGVGLCLMPLHGVPSENKKRVMHQVMERVLMHYLQSIVRRREFAKLLIHVRVGLGDACETAVVAGTIHALAAALFSVAAHPQVCDLQVTPVFSKVCLRAYGQSIFFCRLGDIMLAALKAARRKKREGLKWRSIPLKA